MTDHADDTETPAEREARIRDLSRERPAPERIQRSDAIEGMRSDRAENLEDRRIDRAQRLAVEVALRNERINTRLASHEAQLGDHRERLDAINGSVARAADALKRIETKMDTRDAVNVALIEASAGQGAKMLTRFQKVVAIVGVLFTLGLLITAVLQVVQHG